MFPFKGHAATCLLPQLRDCITALPQHLKTEGRFLPLCDWADAMPHRQAVILQFPLPVNSFLIV